MTSRPSIVYVAVEKPSRGRAPALQILHTLLGLTRTGAKVAYFTPWPAGLIRRRFEELTGERMPEAVSITSLGAGPALPILSRLWPAFAWSGVRSRLRRRLREIRATDPDAVVYTRNRRVAAEIEPGERPPLVFEVHALRFRVEAERSGRPLEDTRIAAQRHGERSAFHRADALAALTRALASDLEAEAPPGRPIHVIPDGVSLRTFRIGEQERRPVPGRFVYVGSLIPWKGLETVLGALTRAPAASLEVHAGSSGDVPRGRALLDLARRLGVEGRVRIHAHVPQPLLRLVLASAVAGLLPLDGRHSIAARYTSPLKLFEYLAAGLPILASDLPSVREVVAHEREALLFEDGNPESLARAMLRVASDSGLARRLGDAARETSLGYTWERRGERIAAVCEEVLRSSRLIRAPGAGC